MMKDKRQESIGNGQPSTVNGRGASANGPQEATEMIGKTEGRNERAWADLLRARSLLHLRKFVRGERGVVAPMVALAMVALFGFLTIVVDAGNMYAQKTELQRMVDAAALAGAQAIATGSSAAAATNYLNQNGFNPATDSLTYNTQAAASASWPSWLTSSETWRVSVTRNVSLGFTRVLGSNPSVTIPATATAIYAPLQAIDCNTYFCMPYVAWAGNSAGVYRHPEQGGLQPGDTVKYKDNGWVKAVVTDNPSGCTAPGPWPAPTTCHWDVNNGSDFKGYLHQPNGMGGTMWSGQNLAPIPAQGGSADPKSLTDRLCNMAQNGTSGLVIAVDPAIEKSGKITFSIVGFVVLKLNTDICKGGGSTGTGIVVKSDTIDQGLPGGPANADSVYVLKLWQ